MKKHQNERAQMLASHLIRQSFKNIPDKEMEQLILCIANISATSTNSSNAENIDIKSTLRLVGIFH